MLGFSTLLAYIAKKGGGGHGESNNAKTKKKTVRNCDINTKIKSLLYALEYIEA